VNSAVVAPVRLDLRTRAAVVVDFALDQLATDGDDDEDVLDFLDEDCEQVEAADGARRWSLKDGRRVDTLGRVPIERLRAARERAVAGTGVLQQMLDRSLGPGWDPDALDVLSAEEARALGVVARWWDGGHAAVPRESRVRTLVGRLSLFDDLRTMANDSFVGRESLLAELRDHFRESDNRPFVIHGIGGMGKSAALARHVVWALDEAAAVVVPLDFDDATLNPYYPADIVARIVQTVARQVEFDPEDLLGEPDDLDLDLPTLAGAANELAEHSARRSESPSRASSVDTLEWVRVIDPLLGLVERPILIVFDTIERVQSRGDSAVYSLLSVVEELCSRGERIRVVLSGRASVPELATARSTNLRGLEPNEAVRLLISTTAPRVTPEAAATVIDQIGTSPLTVRLAAQLLSGADHGPHELFALELQGEQVNAELYRRVLAHIKDDEIRKLAHPGLVLRRITADVIRHVLSPVCGVPVADDDEARSLLARFAAQVTLVDRSPDGRTLVHRPDLRRVMLPQLQRDRPEDSRRIQRAAIRYYAARGDLPSKVEELYHRLMLGQKPATVGKHWDRRAGDMLVAAMDEFPVESRILLAARVPETQLGAADRRLASDATWISQTRPQVLRLVSARKPELALEKLHERRAGGGASLLPALEIEVLESLGRFDEAIAVARDGRRAATAAMDISETITFSLHLARLLERTERGSEGLDVLEAALTAIGEPRTDRLRVLTAWLGLDRRLRNGGKTGHAERQREALAVYKRVGAAAVARVPGLLRDLAAEVGAESFDVLSLALLTVGLDAYPSGSVPAALRDLDRRTTGGAVADIARLSRSGNQVDWNEILRKPRGETGSAISEVLRTFGSEADRLAEAVAHDYQHESDAALLGTDLGPELARLKY
jgi:AAA ATPase domain